MKTLYKRSVEARELPREWREEGHFAPEDRVTVWVEPEDPELAEAASLGEIMDIIGRRMQERGLTEEQIEDIADEHARTSPSRARSFCRPRA